MAQTKQATKDTSSTAVSKAVQRGPQGGAHVGIDPVVLERIRAAEPNRKKLHALIEDAGILQREAAQLIAQQTMRPCSLRSISSWLAGPESPNNARPCPEWAVHALESSLKAQVKSATGKAAAQAKTARSAPGELPTASRKTAAKKSTRKVGKTAKVA